MSNSLVFIPSWKKAILAAPMIEYIICNRWEINLSMRRYSARLTRQKLEIKDTKDHARLI
jgi:hypothetical protein